MISAAHSQSQLEEALDAFERVGKVLGKVPKLFELLKTPYSIVLRKEFYFMLLPIDSHPMLFGRVAVFALAKIRILRAYL